MKRATAVAATFVTLAGLGVLLPLRSDAFAPDGELTSDKTCHKGPLSSPRANCAPPPLPSTGNLNKEIWEHRVPMDVPALIQGDGPIAKFRRWTKQFYA